MKKPIHSKNRVIGLLGGSFNPAHSGHVHITEYALKKLHMDEVWWLVSPQNPLKDKDSLAPYAQRLKSAREMTKGIPHVRVLDTEKNWKTRYSYQTVQRVRARNPGAHFVWLIGADNLALFHKWKRWQWLLHKIPIMIFDRAPYSHRSLRSKAYIRGRKFLLKNTEMPYGNTGRNTRPALRFVHMKRDPASSTDIRKTLGSRAFLRHNKDAG